MSNTLFNYFKKADNGKVSSPSPASPAPVKKETPAKPVKKEDQTLSSKKSNKENKENASAAKPSAKKEAKPDVMEIDDDDEEIVRPSLKKTEAKKSSPSSKSSKRKRLMLLSDSDESDNEKATRKDKKQPKKGDSDYEEDSASDVGTMSVESEEEEEKEAKPKKKAPASAIKNKNLSVAKTDSPRAKANTSVVSSPAGKSATDSAFDSENSNEPFDGKYKHLTYAFLEEDKIKDIQGRLRSHPDYDPRTLYVPDDFRKKLTPGLRQWWDLKQTNFDVIFFFKVGKFYECYHMDAVVAVKELGLTLMKGDYAHCGFPEIAYSRFADSLVSKGYKVARVEQTETPDMMNERTRGTKQDKTVRREICRITTPGTKTFNLLDSDVTNAFSQYLFSFVERVNMVQDKKVRTFGVCFVDTTVGKIYIGQFVDDRNCSKFRTTLAQFPPAHVLYEKNGLSKETKMLIDLQNGLKEPLAKEKDMYGATTVLKMLTESEYFREKDSFDWPESFKPLLSEHDTLGLTPKSDYECAVTALGGLLWCLKKCLIDNEILSMRNFEIYQPIDNIIADDLHKPVEIKKAFSKQKYMVLDSISLFNLEIFENNYDQTQAGTLFEQVDFCMTQFGKRLLKNWLVNPLCDPEAINDRLDAIEDLRSMEEKFTFITDNLRSLPDLERLISKIHQLGNVNKNHPDSRAIMYENDTYSKRKVEDFILIMNGFSTVTKLLQGLKEHCSSFKSKLLKTILTIIKEEETEKKLGFPFLNDLIHKFTSSFDAEQAKKTGKIIPAPGLNEDYDQAIEEIKGIESELASYLKSQSKELGCAIVYVGTNKNRYQLELPENKCKSLSMDYELTSSRKGFKRYWTDETKDMLARMLKAEESREQALRDSMKAIFKKFDQHYNVWNRAVQCLAILDVLVSLTLYVKNASNDMCRPEIVCLDEASGPRTPFLDIKNGRHPCLIKTFSGDFIPNDVVIGCEDTNNNWQKKPLVLVTGPNMGGKSTLMRQAGLTVILAQIGSYVPAESCRLTPVDRIFTRIGATDKILAGESTFFLELSETASILHHATKHSLVLMDELGRGTATFDGTSIAYSVVKELAQKIHCRTLFSTHYHHLVEEFSTDRDNVSMGHMQCMVSDDDQNITFLYKFGEGACPKSHGFNAARLADIPDEIIKVGSVKSVEFENFTKRIQFLKKIKHAKTKVEINDLIAKFQTLKS